MSAEALAGLFIWIIMIVGAVCLGIWQNSFCFGVGSLVFFFLLATRR